MSRCHALNRLLVLVLIAPGCASTTPKSPHGDPVGAANTVTKDMVTVENLLRWSLEGRAGVGKVAAGLKQVFELEEVEPSWFMSEGPVRLADGYILRSTWIGPGTNRIDIGVEGLPCFPPERAMELTGAVQGIVRTDMHGGEYGKEYAVENYGIRLTFETTPLTYKCVDSIYITPALPQLPPGNPDNDRATATVTKDVVTVDNLLRWPLDGQSVGIDKVIAGLREVYKMETLTNGYYAKGAKSLADDYVLSFVTITNITGAIDIGLKEEPCYPAERATAEIRAVPDPVVEDAHGVDRGRSFKTTQNGVTVDFSTTPLTYRCVTSIHIKPTHKEKVP